jgi:hypothetical protein
MERLRIVVTGLIGSIPLAGLTLHYLQYILGLHQLGHDVLYLEDTGTWYYDPHSDDMLEDSSPAVEFLGKTMAAYGLSDRWSFVDHHQNVSGVSGLALEGFLRTADLFINVTGAGQVRDEYLRIPRRAYIDTDPGFIQIRVANGSHKDREHLQRHTTHFSFGCNIGLPDCTIPSVDLTWHPTVQPLCLDLWPVAAAPDTAPFTTILKWQSYQPVEYGGEVYGLKDMEFRKFQRLPQETNQALELASTGHCAAGDLGALGWKLRDAREISDAIDPYRQYIQQSRGEWSVAKNGYVKLRSGWFGDRSASYLASGRPVILQSTGYEQWLPTGNGVFAFKTTAESVHAFEQIDADYKRQCRAARQLAEQHFDARTVLSRLINVAMSSD